MNGEDRIQDEKSTESQGQVDVSINQKSDSMKGADWPLIGKILLVQTSWMAFAHYYLGSRLVKLSLGPDILKFHERAFFPLAAVILGPIVLPLFLISLYIVLLGHSGVNISQLNFQSTGKLKWLGPWICCSIPSLFVIYPLIFWVGRVVGLRILE